MTSIKYCYHNINSKSFTISENETPCFVVSLDAGGRDLVECSNLSGKMHFQYLLEYCQSWKNKSPVSGNIRIINYIKLVGINIFIFCSSMSSCSLFCYTNPICTAYAFDNGNRTCETNSGDYFFLKDTGYESGECKTGGYVTYKTGKT